MNGVKLKQLISSPAFPGVVLLLVAVIAFVWANSPAAGWYEAMKGVVVTFPVPALNLSKPLELWINDLLMAVFFLLVGLELKREIVRGELSDPRRAGLAIFAALGGMVVPALFYVALNGGDPSGLRGWGVPMATDIAFAVGILTLLGRRVPLALRIFLTALAVVDDMGAVIVIALFYTSSLNLTMLLLALGVFVALWGLNAARVGALTPYLLLGLVMWYFVLKSGLHATIAGVLLATTIPMGKGDHTPLEKLEHGIAPFVTFFVMPIFALFNAGVPVAAALAGGVSVVTMGTFLGLTVGKPLGILGFSWLAVQLRLAQLPRGATWSMVLGIGFLGGVGFTMALFIANLAFGSSVLLEQAKLGVLAASVAAGVLGLTWLRFSTRHYKGPSAELVAEAG
jgi:Na+:H+ antiporter, NhaA family